MISSRYPTAVRVAQDVFNWHSASIAGEQTKAQLRRLGHVAKPLTLLLSLTVGACMAGNKEAELREAHERRRAIIDAMLEEAESYKFKACGAGTECYVRIAGYGDEIRELDSMIAELSPGTSPWRDGIPGLVDPRFEPDGTAEQYRNTAERQRLQERLVAARLADSQPDPEDPDAVLTMGGPGSGKTTVLEVLGVCQDDVVRINSDEFKADLVEYTVAVAARDRLASSRVHQESSLLAERTREEAIRSRRDFCYDGTLSETQATLDLVDQLQRDGYDVTVVATAIPFEIGWERIQARAQETGRFVPRDYAEQAYDNVATHAEWVLRAVAVGYLFSTDVPLGEPPLLIAKYVSGQQVEGDPR